MLDSVKRLIVTMSYLKLRQIYYRVYYVLRREVRRKFNIMYPLSLKSKSTSLDFKNPIPSYTSVEEKTFSFLNLKYNFSDDIDWNYMEFGKLWTYNLTYFDYLNQKHMPKEKGVELIYDFISKMPDIKDGLESFPISLRGINWIKFLIKHQLEDEKIDNTLYAQYFILMDNIEYHLLGNHLLENGFSLLFGAYYFKDEKLYAKAREILNTELEEQILLDGGHFELSPMYHQIMLVRILDCINLLQNNPWKDESLLMLLKEKASHMIGWLEEMTFSNGAIPLFNDSANGITATTRQLNRYADELGIKGSDVLLSDSGYRKIKKAQYECVIDIGNIGPDYIPGHAHSDTFNFELYIHGEPFIVDTGVSTYATNERRQLERSTCSHNTVVVNGKNQSHVWGGFKVAERAQVIDILEKDGIIKATHNGYIKQGILHTRSFECGEEKIVIKDTLRGSTGHTCIAYLHFYPGINVTIEKNVIQCANATIRFSGLTRISLGKYEYAPEFNSREKAIYAKIFFDYELNMQILVKEI